MTPKVKIVGFIFLMACLSITSSFENAYLDILGEFSQIVTVGLLVIMFLLLALKPIKADPIIGLLFSYLLVCVIGLLWSANQLRSIVHLTQISSILFLMIGLKNQKSLNAKLFFVPSVIYLVFVFFHWLIDGAHISFSGMYSHRNANGSHLLFLSFFGLNYFIIKKNRVFLFLFLLALIVLLIFIASRSTWIAMFFIAFTYFFWNIICRNHKRAWAYFLSVLIFISGFISVYLYLASSSNSSFINQLIMEYTGRQLFSGREDIWPQILALIEQKWFLGFGPGTIPDDFTDLSQNANSAHNLYIQTLFQTGTLGLIIFIFVFIAIWNVLIKNWNLTGTRLVAAFYVGILIHQLFEVTLTQNKFSLGLIQWFIIGIGLYYPSKKYNETIISC